jgi:voltage-gated potassium channel
VSGAGRDVVVVDRDPERIATVPHCWIEGDATDEVALRAAGIERAGSLIAALNTDADNIYVTLTARSIRANLFIVSRARVPSAGPRLEQAGANRVVNPQHIGGARMAALALQPAVADFLDVVMHDGSLEFRLGEVDVPASSPLAGQSLRQTQLRDRTGALILALRQPDGTFVTNPGPEAEITAGQVLIAIGTSTQLDALHQIAH